MNKSPVALIAAIAAAATMLASSAEAGFHIRLGFGGPLPAFTAHGNGGGYSERHCRRHRYIVQHTRKKEKTYAAKHKAVSEPKVAKVEKSTPKREKVAAAPVVDPDTVADSENSSITSVDLVPEKAAAVVEPNPVAPVVAKIEEPSATKPAPIRTSSKLDCKKFFPSVGMTLTVPCE